MSNKLPPDFDPEWYGATYPDVGLSGLSPHDHYRLFGSLFRRPHKAGSAGTAAAPIASPALEELSPSKFETARNPAPGSNETQAATIIDRPAHFDPSAGIPASAPDDRRRLASSLSFDELTRGPIGFDRKLPASTQAARAYAALFGIEEPGRFVESQGIASCGASVFQSGATRIERAWLVTPSRLRLLLAGGAEDAPLSEPLVFRAYQALPTSPANFQMLGNGTQLPAIGPLLHDFELVHPLMPLLLELSACDGSTSNLTLMPFPSLLPGGLHGAELKALQTERSPIDDFWARSEALLQEALGGDGWPRRIASHVSVAGEGSNSDWRALQPTVKEWLSAVFGVSLQESDTPPALAHQLILPTNSVPTISALVSRRLQSADGESLTGPYLVVDAEHYRPRWSVSLPANEDSEANVPRVEGFETARKRGWPIESKRVPLAITICAPHAESMSPSAPQVGSLQTEALSVLVYAAEASRTELLIEWLRSIAGEELDLLIAYDESDVEVRDALNRACGRDAWTAVPHLSDHRLVAKKARHEVFLTVSDRVVLDDGGGALAGVLGLLRRHERAGSASCALLAEKIVKNDIILQPASGGLFPTGVSFVNGPGLAFGEPDVQQALRGRTYPVVANTLLFTAWRRSALLQLPPPSTTEPARAADIRTGLDLMRAGYDNWCTTLVTARLSGQYVMRDQIDPVGPGYLLPERWENILRRVTLVRELS